MFNKEFILQAMSQVLFGMLGALIIQLVFFHSSQQIVTVDIVGIVKSFENEILKQNLSHEEYTQKATRFGEALNSSIITYSQNKHVILVPKEVILAGNIDKTDEIKIFIKKRMNS
jgi:hypothetical protein